MRASLAIVLVGLVTACSGAGDGFAVTAMVTAGPVCPVAQDPPDPACADRPVPDATLVVVDAATGEEVATAVTGADGEATVMLVPGRYRFVPQPVPGLLGTADPVDVAVVDASTSISLVYDTGIRGPASP